MKIDWRIDVTNKIMVFPCDVRISDVTRKNQQNFHPQMHEFALLPTGRYVLEMFPRLKQRACLAAAK